MERTELALVQRRGTTADKLALLPHEPIRAGWTKSTARNKMRLLIRRQQAGAAEEPVEGDIRHRCVGPLGVGRSRDSCPRVAEGERGPTDVCVMSSACSLRSERGGITSYPEIVQSTNIWQRLVFLDERLTFLPMPRLK